MLGDKLEVPGSNVGPILPARGASASCTNTVDSQTALGHAFLEPTLPEPAHFSWFHVRTGHASTKLPRGHDNVLIYLYFMGVLSGLLDFTACH